MGPDRLLADMMRMRQRHIEELREQQKRQKIKYASARAMIPDPRLLWAFETECPDASKVERERGR